MANAEYQFPDRPGFAVGDDVCAARTPSARRHGIECRNQRVGGVVDVGRVDKSSTATDDGEPPRPGSFDDPADQLSVPRTPHQVRSHSHDCQVGAVGRKH